MKVQAECGEEPKGDQVKSHVGIGSCGSGITQLIQGLGAA